MKRRNFLRSAAGAGVCTLSAPMLNLGRFRVFASSGIKYSAGTKHPAGGTEYSARAIELIGRSVVVDMLGLLTLDWQKLQRWQKDPKQFTADDLTKLKQSGISMFHPAVELATDDPHAAASDLFSSWNSFFDQQKQSLLRVDQGGDIARAKSEGKIAILLGMQNSCHFRTVADVSTFQKLGQRLSQLTYNARNAIGCGCMEKNDTGLTDYGQAIVAEMGRVRMAIDVSHVGDRTAMDAIDGSNRPVLITHANCRALAKHPRCKPDSTIRALARKGGVMGITGVRTFVHREGPATISHVLDHFDYVTRLAGVEHVGIGSDTDLDGRDQTHMESRNNLDIAGLNHPKRMFDLTEGLIRRGYSDESIGLILGGNFQRVLGQIWA